MATADITYETFSAIATEARHRRNPQAGERLLEAYAAMGCAVYPADVALFVALWGGMPTGWTWDVYHAGHGGFTNVRRAAAPGVGTTVRVRIGTKGSTIGGVIEDAVANGHVGVRYENGNFARVPLTRVVA